MISSARGYYRAALARIEDAHLLHDEGHYTFAMYASGLAVECLLRAFRLLRDSSFDERHDLWQLWKKAELADIHNTTAYNRIYPLMSQVYLLWRNSHRFASEADIRVFLKKLGRDRGLKGDFLKYNSTKLKEAAQEFLQIGGQQWLQSSKK